MLLFPIKSIYLLHKEDIAKMIERAAAVTSKGKPLTVIGKQLQVGGKAPNFELLANDLSVVKLADSAGKVRLISVTTSLDTGICDAQTRRFNEEIDQYGDNVIGYTVSADLPFAQARWCGAAGVERVQTLSDHPPRYEFWQRLWHPRQRTAPGTTRYFYCGCRRYDPLR
jgi:peroxiredoxin